jgi:hypothetical protein
LMLWLLFDTVQSLSARLRLAVLTLGTVVAATLPWQLYQSASQSGLTVGATNVAGWNLFKGNALAFEDVSPYIDHDNADGYVELLRERYRMDPPPGIETEDEYLRALALEDMRGDPARFLRKAALKAAVYLSPLETPLGEARVVIAPDAVHLTDYRGHFAMAARDWLRFARQMSFFIVLFAIPLGILGAISAAARPADSDRRRLAIATLGFLLLNIAAHAVITAETRYRLYLDPLLLLWAGLAVHTLFSASASPPAAPT